ncbi:MAG: hypothetical protein WA056_05285 [Gallionella sp.]
MLAASAVSVKLPGTVAVVPLAGPDGGTLAIALTVMEADVLAVSSASMAISVRV